MVPLFKKKREDFVEDSSEDYLTIEEDFVYKKKEGNSDKIANIRVFVLDDFDAIREILDVIRENSTICLIDIHLLRNKDPDELKRAIDKLKKTVEAVGGELVGFHESWILAAPSFIEIHKGMK